MSNSSKSAHVGTRHALIALLLAAAAACGSSTSTESDTRTVQGPSLALGAGTVHGYITLDAQSHPVSVGVAFSDSALINLPTDALPGLPPGRMLTLALPPEANAAGYDHVMLNWNAAGHDPVQIYGAPHMDVHIYSIPLTQQLAMTPADSLFDVKSAKKPASSYVPGTYFPLGAGVPMMGAHWGDPSSPELAPAPNAKPFTRTFLYGSYDGHFIFFEPMVTTSTLLATRTLDTPDESLPIQVPAQYEKAGDYPTRYVVRYDGVSHQYIIALEGLVHHN
ncbi:MAG: DUF5602 domain-containing protein [bacterium]